MNSGLETTAGVQETSGYEIMDTKWCLFFFKTPVTPDKTKIIVYVIYWCGSQFFYCHNTVHKKILMFGNCVESDINKVCLDTFSCYDLPFTFSEKNIPVLHLFQGMIPKSSWTS